MGQSIVFFATAWGTRYGGINSFNFDICRALAKVVKGKYEIICVVPRAEKDQIKEAEKEGVKLLSLRDTGDDGLFVSGDIEEVKKLFPASSEDEVLWWIGHDVKTGRIAINAAQKIGRGQIAIFHHMHYQSYRGSKDNTKEEIVNQRDVLTQGNIIFALGPKLTRSAEDMARASDQIRVKELFPGLHNIKCIKKAPRNFSAIIFGRLDKHTDYVKQSRLAVAAFSDACSSEKHATPLEPESSLMVIGLPEGDEGKSERKELKDLSFEEAGRRVQIHPWPYFENRTKLFDELKRKSVCLVTSLYEGFGLVGWEAICAEVPLIISENTGLYEFVKDRVLGGRGCLESIDIKGSSKGDYLKKDVKKVSRKILKVKKDIEKAKEEAVTLKEMVGKLYTWENCALAFAKALGISVEVPRDKESLSEDTLEEICREMEITKEQCHEMLNNIKSFYGF